MSSVFRVIPLRRIGASCQKEAGGGVEGHDGDWPEALGVEPGKKLFLDSSAKIVFFGAF